MAPVHQEGAEYFVRHIMKLSGESVAGSQAGPNLGGEKWG